MEILARAIREEKTPKGYESERRKSSHPCLPMTWVSIWETRRLYNTVLELVRVWCKVAGNKIYTQKSIAFVFRNNSNAEKELTRSVHSLLQKKFEYTGTNLVKDVWHLYEYKGQTLKTDTKTCKHLPCLWIGEVNIVKFIWNIETNLEIQYNLIKIPTTLFLYLEKKWY